MENEQFTTLVNTLLSNNLASSQTEARKMAEEMIDTSAKVQDSFKKENHTYMVSNFSQKEDHQVREQQAEQNVASEQEMPQLRPEPSSNSESMQQNIQELRERAINSQPVDVQVNFQTPQYDARRELATGAIQDAPPQQTSTEDLAKNLEVNIPGVDTSQTLNNLNGASHTPQADCASTREKDDFLTVRLEASSEQTPISSPEDSLQAEAQPVQNEPVEEPSHQAPTSSFGGLETGFPTQAATEPAPSNPAPQQAAEPETQANVPQTNTPERKKDLWTPEEKQLVKDCDLSKVFNFSGQ